MRQVLSGALVAVCVLAGCGSGGETSAGPATTTSQELRTTTTLGSDISGTCTDASLSGDVRGELGFISYTGGVGCDLAKGVANDSGAAASKADGAYESHGFKCNMTHDDGVTYNYTCESENRLVRFLLRVG